MSVKKLLSLILIIPSFSQAQQWVLVKEENFNSPISFSSHWVKDPLNETSPWSVDQFDDNGSFWHSISDPHFSEVMKNINMFRKRITFGEDNWLTAELAFFDKKNQGLSNLRAILPSVKIVDLEKNNKGLQLSEPHYNGGILIRPTKPLPNNYRVEVSLRKIDFGGKRGGTLEYDNKYNGYQLTDECKTAYPWAPRGPVQGKNMCQYHPVLKENGFYYLTILDYPNPSPHNNVNIHFRRKVIIDGYYSAQYWSDRQAVCNPKTKELYFLKEGSLNVINAIFALGDRFKPNLNNGYLMKTPCGTFEDIDLTGKYNQHFNKFEGIVSTAEIQPELLPNEEYIFAVERDDTGYTLEMTGNFLHIEHTTLRAKHGFNEDNKPIWHYNQTPKEYAGEYNKTLVHPGETGTLTISDIWEKGSSYPDSFIIGDPHLNFYEGSAIIDNIRLYKLKE